MLWDLILFQVSLKAATSSKVCHCGALVSLESQRRKSEAFKNYNTRPSPGPTTTAPEASSQGLENSGLMGERWHVCQLASEDIHIFCHVCDNLPETSTRGMVGNFLTKTKHNYYFSFNGLYRPTTTLFSWTLIVTHSSHLSNEKLSLMWNTLEVCPGLAHIILLISSLKRSPSSFVQDVQFFGCHTGKKNKHGSPTAL